MSYIPKSDSVIAFQPDYSKLEVSASVVGLTPVSVSNTPSVISSGLSVVDANNTTTVALGGNATFTGTGTNILGYAGVSLLVESDQSSATGGVQIQFSSDNINWDDSMVDTFTAGSSAPNAGQVWSAGARAKFMRVVYVNGSAAQGNFRLQTILRFSDPVADTRDISQPIMGNAHALTTHGVITGITTAGGGSYVDVKVNPSGALAVAATQSGTWISSVVNTIPSSFLAGVSVIGLTPVNVSNFPTNQSISGQITVVSSIPGGIFPISGSVAAVVTNSVNVNGSVVSFQGGSRSTSISGGISSVALVGANTVSVVGNVNVGGSVVAFQGTLPWVISSVYGNIAGSVAAFQAGTWNVSIVGTLSGTAATTSVRSSISSISILTANTSRKGATIYNDSDTSIMVKLGTAATNNDFTVLMNDTDYYEIPFGYTGNIAGISSSNAGIIRVTELT